MTFVRMLVVLTWCASVSAVAAPPKVAVQAPLTADGERLFADYETQRRSRQVEIVRALPTVDPQETNALQSAREALKKVQADADAAQQALGEANEAPEKTFVGQAPVDASGQQVAARPDGTIVVPADAHGINHLFRSSGAECSNDWENAQRRVPILGKQGSVGRRGAALRPT